MTRKKIIDALEDLRPKRFKKLFKKKNDDIDWIIRQIDVVFSEKAELRKEIEGLKWEIRWKCKSH